MTALVRKVNPRDFGRPGRAFWITVDPATEKAMDRFDTKREAVKAAEELAASCPRCYAAPGEKCGPECF